VDMHRPEAWGYVQFSAAPPGTATLRPDPTLPARRWLSQVYYAEREGELIIGIVQYLGPKHATLALGDEARRSDRVSGLATSGSARPRPSSGGWFSGRRRAWAAREETNDAARDGRTGTAWHQRTRSPREGRTGGPGARRDGGQRESRDGAGRCLVGAG